LGEAKPQVITETDVRRLFGARCRSPGWQFARALRKLDAMTKYFHGDRPISDGTDDRFGIAEVSDRIAHAMLEQSGSKGFVLGIEGAWGSGKSSLLSLVLDRVRAAGGDTVSAVEFRPWLVGDRDQLLVELFDALAKAIAELERLAGDATKSTVQTAKGVAEKVRGFARHLGPAGKLTGLAGLAIPGLNIVGTAIEKIAEAAVADTGGPTLAAQKDDLSGALEKLGGRIVVAVDDVDRLEPREVAELLRLVRSVADFPNVTYLLCYDGATLAKSIQTATGVADGRAFLEKIVQTEITIPRPESFALRRMFSAELETFATCEGEVGQRLLQVIDMAGGRCFDTPRTVRRVLDSLRLFWPPLEGKVDLADLVWLRIIAVACPNTYRWVEEYLDTLSAMATGRATVTDRERNDLMRRMDEGLAADGTDWERVMIEFHHVLPRMGWAAPKDAEEDRRLFAIVDHSAESYGAQRRLASPDHSRLYFAMARAPGTVDLADIDALLNAACASETEASSVLAAMADEMNVAGSTKAERMLDQLRNLPSDRFKETNARNLVFAIVAVAERLASAHDEEWGHPRAWSLSKKVLAAIKRAGGEAEWTAILSDLFAHSPHLDWLTFLLRDETFDHGVYGDRPNPSDAITTKAQFETVRDAMFVRYRALGIAEVAKGPRAPSALYAWSQADGRQEVAAAVAAHVADDDARLIEFLLQLSGIERGRQSNLAPDGLRCFFDDVPSLLERLMNLTLAKVDGAGRIVQMISSSLRFENNSLKEWIESARQAKKDAQSDGTKA
jgi:predicted KAP-like P-loop ATPase